MHLKPVIIYRNASPVAIASANTFNNEGFVLIIQTSVCQRLFNHLRKMETLQTESFVPKADLKSLSFLYFAASIANLTSFAVGIFYSWTSPVLPQLTAANQSNPLGRPVTPIEVSWITGLLSLGTLISPIVAGIMANKIGRKKSLLLIAGPMLAALLIAAFANSVFYFCFSRILMGLGAGGTLTVLPMYLGEVAEDHNRGRITSLNGVFISLGMLFTYAIGPFLTVRNFCLLCTTPLIIFVTVFAVWIPESPYFFALNEDEENVFKTLSKLRRDKNRATIELEVAKIAENIQKRRRNKGIKDLFGNKESRKALLIALVLELVGIYSGKNAIFAYMQMIFTASGSNLSPKFCPIVVATVHAVITLFSFLLIDKLGRRFLLLLSTSGCCVSLLVLGLHFHLVTNKAASWLPVVSVLAFVVFLSVGLGSVPFILLAELFSPHVKAAASTLASFVRSVGNISVTGFFPLITLSLGMAQTFWMFALVCFSGATFVYFTVPETKGKSFQQIRKMLLKEA